MPWFDACCARPPDLRHLPAVVCWHLSVCFACGRSVPLWRASWPGAVRRAPSGLVAVGALVGFPDTVVPFSIPGAFAPGSTGRPRGARGGRPRPGSLCLPLVPAEAGALGSLRMVPVWRVPPASVSGCVRCGGLRVWTRSLMRPVFGTVRRLTGDSAGAPGLFRVDGNTSPCGSGDATPGSRACVHVRALLGRVGQAGVLGAFWFASRLLWPLSASALLGPLLAGVALFMAFCFPSPPPFFLSPPSLCPLSLACFGFWPRVPWAFALCAPPPVFLFISIIVFRFLFFLVACLVGCLFHPALLVVCCLVWVCGAVCCAVLWVWVRCSAASLRAAPPGVVLFCALLCCFAPLLPLLAVSVALGSSAFRPCVLWCSPALCALCCVCFAVVCWCELLFAAVLCAVCACCVCPGVSYCAFVVLSTLCSAVLRCAGVLALCCSCGPRCLWCLVLWCVAVCCAVSCGVLWCGAGFHRPQLSSGGVFRCQGPSLAAWPAPLWLVWFAVVPCSRVLCSVVLCCRALLSVCGAVCGCSFIAVSCGAVLPCVAVLLVCAVCCP